MSSPLHVETEWNPEFERDIPVRIVCNACGKARALSTPTAVLIESFGVVYDPEDRDSTWVRQSEDFRENHRCGEERRQPLEASEEPPHG